MSHFFHRRALAVLAASLPIACPPAVSVPPLFAPLCLTRFRACSASAVLLQSPPLSVSCPPAAMSSQGGPMRTRQQRGAQQRLTAARRATTQQATDGRDSRQMRAQTQRNARLRCSKPCIAHSLVLACVCVCVLVLAVVDVMQLPVADLQKLRQSLTEDVQTITQNYGNLKVRRAARSTGQAARSTSQTQGTSVTIAPC